MSVANDTLADTAVLPFMLERIERNRWPVDVHMFDEALVAESEPEFASALYWIRTAVRAHRRDGRYTALLGVPSVSTFEYAMKRVRLKPHLIHMTADSLPPIVGYYGLFDTSPLDEQLAVALETKRSGRRDTILLIHLERYTPFKAAHVILEFIGTRSGAFEISEAVEELERALEEMDGGRRAEEL